MISVLSVLMMLLALCGEKCGAKAEAQESQEAGTNAVAPFELSGAVQLDDVDAAVHAQLDRAKSLLADRQWAEAVEIFCRLSVESENRLLEISPGLYIPLCDACGRLLAAMPPEALQLYRARVDPTAKKWLEEGVARRDRDLLRNVVERTLASSYGCDALLALGAIALESGEYTAARAHWGRIAEEKGRVSADVLARLVLTSILEGDRVRARDELAAFARLHPDARGRLGRREGRYVSLLKSLLTESESWPDAATAADWPTFAGNPQRNRMSSPLVDFGAPVWRALLTSVGGDGAFGRRMESISDDSRVPVFLRPHLSLHPVSAGNLIFACDARRIFALRCDVGRAAWGTSAVIFEMDSTNETDAASARKLFGTPQFTMTVFRNRLYARMGSVATARPAGASPPVDRSCLVCLDLTAQGRLLWQTEPGEDWKLEGAPVVDARGVYAALRRGDIRPQAAVACFDPDTGRLRWRRAICSAETPARGVLAECTHNLLTLAEGVIYYNTNLGAVAAIRADDGRPLWVRLYPRALRGDLARLVPHWRRSPSPCLFDRGTLYVAPADSPRIFAFDAASGRMLWQTGDAAADATDLLGVAGDWLIAGGDRLFWIDLRRDAQGRVRRVWPEGAERPGLGRGLLTGDERPTAGDEKQSGAKILWPTRDKLYIFDARTARLEKTFDLATRGVSGGNLLIVQGRLLIAAERGLTMIGPAGGKDVRGGTNTAEQAR